MREIKFRAWDGKRMSSHTFRLDDEHVSFDDHRSYSTISREVDLWEVMQYTGLKDKSGKEIYEGDIALYERYISAPCDYHSGEPYYPEGTYTRRGHVTITTSMGVTLNGIQRFEPDDLGEKKESRKYNQNPNCWGEYAEVIGNIYESPELLEAK